MSRNFQRQMAMMDTPCGDLGAFKKEGGKIKLYDMGGGGGSAPANQTQTAELPEWARGYAKDTLAKGAALTDVNQNPYQAYSGQRVAGLGDLQQQAIAQAGPEGFQKTVGSYMSPYQQNVIDIQKREAARQSGIQGVQQQAQAAQAGAFGGGRDAIMRAERERNLATQMNDIQAQGSQSAYDRATAQYNQGLNQMNTLGGLQQQQAQKGLDVAYQDFTNQQNYPYKQLGFMADMVRGIPVGQQTSIYGGQPNVLGQLAGLGMGAYGISRMADGGEVKGYAGDEGSVVEEMNDPAMLSDNMDSLTDKQLQDIAAQPATVAEMRAAQEELAFRASRIRGLASGLDEKTSLRLAGGGVVAFAEPTRGNNYSLVDESLYDASPRTVDEMKQGESSLMRWFRNSKGMPNIEVDENGQPTGREFPVATSDLKPRSDVPAGGPDLLALDAERRAKVASTNKGGAGTTVGNRTTQNRAPLGGPAPAVAEPRSLLDEYKDAHKFMQEGNKDQVKGIEDLYKLQNERTEKMRGQRGAEMMAAFGMDLAQRSSQGGAPGLSGLLRNASAASPTLVKTAMENRRLAQAADDNAAKMQIELTKYKVSLDKGDQTAAMSYAQNVRQLQQQQTQLNEMIRHNKATEGIASSRAAAGNVGLERAMLQSKSAIWNNSLKQAAKDWGDPLKAKELKNQYGSQKAYAKDLFEQGWSQTMPQLSYLGRLDASGE